MHLYSFQDDEGFEGFADAELLESKEALERTMQELGGGYEHWADVLDEVNRTAPQALPLNKKSTSSNLTKVAKESVASNGRTRKTRPITMRVRPGMRDVVQRSYAEMNKHGFDTDDSGDETTSSSAATAAVVNDVVETTSIEEPIAATVHLSHPAEDISRLRPPCKEGNETAKLVDHVKNNSNANIRPTRGIQSAVNSEALKSNDVCRPTPFQPLVLNSTSASLDNVVQVSNGNSLKPPPPVQRKAFMLPEKSARSSRIIFPKKRNMEDFEFSDVITTADEKRTKVHKTHGRIGVKFPQVALSESDCIDEPAFWSKLSEKHGLDCGERMREEISRYTERMARTATHRKGISPQRAGSSSSPSSSSSAAMTMTTMKVSHSPGASRSANGSICSGTGSPLSSPTENPGSKACETGKPNADKVAAKIQQILRSQWEGRLEMPKRTRGRPKKMGITSSPSAGVRAEAEQRRVSARLRTKTILRKARLKLNKRTLLKLRQPANLRRLSEQCRTEQDKVSAPFRLLKFPTVQLKAIDSLSASVHLPSKPSSSTSSSSSSSSSTSLDASNRASSISIPFGQRGALCSGATVWPTHTFGDITQHPNCGLEDSFRLSSWTEANGGSSWMNDDSIFSKLTLPPAITVKSLPLINPYITISKLDTSKILNNTVNVKGDRNSFHDVKSEDKSFLEKEVEPMGNEKHNEPTEGEDGIETIVCPPAPAYVSAIETKDLVPVLEHSLGNRGPTVSSEPIKRSRGRKAHPLWSRARRPSGPRVKHVCRHASVVLGLPIATFPAYDSSTSSSCSSTPRKESKAGLFFPGILSKLKNKCTLNNGKSSKSESKKSKKNRDVARRNTRCKKCVGCLMPDCEKCVYCLDRSKYGGTNRLKQACKFRICLERPQFTKKSRLKKLSNKLEENGEKRTVCASSHVSETGSPEFVRRSKSKITAAKAVVRRLLKKTKAVSQKKEKAAAPSIKEPAKPSSNKKVIDKSNGDCDISVQASSRDPSLVDVTFWEDYDLAQIWEDGMPAMSSALPVLRASCFLCGSAGLEELIYCILCCEPFHLFCLDSADIPCDGNFDNWCCRRCQYCQVCGQRDSLLKCFECHNTYHAACLGDNYPTRPSKKKKIWICTRCVRCKSCGATSPGKSAAAHWMCDFSLCYDCGKLFDKGNFCPMCKCCYEDDDDQSKMVLCSKCDSWVHAKCANMTDEEYQVLTFLPDSEVVYLCGICSPDNAHSWMSIVMTELYAGFSKILETLSNSKHGKFLRTKGIFSEKRSVRIRISPLQQSVIQDLNDTSQTKYNERNFLPKSLTETDELGKTKKHAAVALVSKPLSEQLSVVDETSGDHRLENQEPLPALHVDIPVDKPQCVIKSSPLSSKTGNRLHVAFVDGAPSDLYELIRKVNDKKYTSVVQFCEDVVRVVRFGGSLTRSNTKPVRELFNTTLEKTFPWFQWSESVLWGDKRKNLLPDAVMPPNVDHSYAQYLCRSVNGETMPQPSIYRHEQLLCSSEPPNGLCADALLLKLKAKECSDTRLCALCGVQGDSNSEVNGRLLYCGQDDWVHVNCALWSAEVFEEVDGSLQRVHSAILRGNKMKCAECDRPGATVGCCCQGCTINYHFACAQRDGAVFQEDKSVYCRLHVHLATGKHVSGSDFQVRHIMYVDLDGLHPKWTKKTWLHGLHPSSIAILVGSMTVESLGEVTGVSDHVEAIIPINFCCTRLYWSTKNPRQRVVYTCRTVLDSSNPEPIMQPKAEENHTIEHITVAGSEITEPFCSSPCLLQSALKNDPFTTDSVTNDGDDVEELTVIMCQDKLERCLPIEMLSDFCQDCMKESAISVDNCKTNEPTTGLMVDRFLKEGNVISLIDPPPPSAEALQNAAAAVDNIPAETKSELVTVAESLVFHEDDISKVDHLVDDDSSNPNCDSIATINTVCHKEVLANGCSTNIESFAVALQELVCNVLHSGQQKLTDTEKMHHGKGKGKEVIGTNQRKMKVTADMTSSKAANTENNNGGVSHWNGSLLRLQQLLSDKRGGQNHNSNNNNNNNNNDCHKKNATKSNGKSSCDVRLPKVLLQCRKCNEAVKSANSNSNKIVGPPRDLLSLTGIGTRMATTVSKRNKNGCMRALSSSVPAIICDGSSSGSASMMPSELASPWFQLDAHDNGGDDSDVDEECIENVENRDYVSLALSRACCNVLCGGHSLERRTSIVTTVLNEKKIEPIGGTDSQSTHMKPSTTNLTERIASSMTCNGGSQSSAPFLETPPPGGGSAANHQSDGNDDAKKASDVSRSEKNTASSVSQRSVRGNPLRCPKCKRIYRTAESFQRHYQTCDFEVDSSSSSEDEEAISSLPTTTTMTVNPVEQTCGSKSDATVVCVSQLPVSNNVEVAHSESVASSSNNSSGPPVIQNEPLSMSSKSRLPQQSTMGALTSTRNSAKSVCLRHPKRILPKTSASGCLQEQQQTQQRMAAPSNLSRTIERVVRMVSPQTQAAAAAALATQPIPSYVSQHQQHHVIQVQGRTFMIPICHVPAQSQLQHQQAQQPHDVQSYAEQLSYLGSLHLSSQGQLTSVSLNVPVSQFTLPTVGGPAFYQQQHPQHTHLVHPAVHLSTAGAAVAESCNQQQMLIAPQLQHQVALHNYSLSQQSVVQQQQNENWGEIMRVDMPNQFSALQSVQPDNADSEQHETPLTCSIASQTQLSPPPSPAPPPQLQQQQFPPNEITEARINSVEACIGQSLIIDDVEALAPLETREYREAETSTDFDILCDPSLPATDGSEEVSTTSPSEETKCCIVQAEETAETLTSVESTTQTTSEDNDGQYDHHQQQHDKCRVTDVLDEASEFADLLKKVSQQIASLASSKGRMACAILPARPPSCSSNSRRSPVNANFSTLANVISDSTSRMHEDVRVEPYAATVEIEQRSSSSDSRTQLSSCDAVPPTPAIRDSKLSRTEFVPGERSENPGGSGPRIAFEITSEDGFHIRSASVDEAWRTVAERVQEVRAASQMRHLSTEGVSGLKMFGVTNRAVRYVLEQLPGTEQCRKFQFIYHHKDIADEAYENKTGCSRSEVFKSRKQHDMFNFLASRHRLPPEYTPPVDEEELQFKSSRRATSLELPMAMRFRHIGRTAHEAVGAYRSKIHGRGLFCKRNIDAGEMVIEYAGEVIRSILTDKREKYYDAKGIGCYMFKIDDNEVVDATMHGNAARFINHSCEPNCYSKVISVDGKKHIVIFALRRIMSGEELTYDYKFPIEDDKIPCTCGSRKCRRYLN